MYPFFSFFFSFVVVVVSGFHLKAFSIFYIRNYRVFLHGKGSKVYIHFGV